MRWLVAVIAIAGCYRPASDRACAVTCEVDPQNPANRGPCPGSLTCGADGLCYAADGTCGPADANPSDVILIDTITLDAFMNDAGQSCFGQFGGKLKVCLASVSPTDVTLSGTIDTSVGTPDCAAYSPSVDPRDDVCLIAARHITGSTVATGTRPLVLLATESISIGTIDVASHQAITSRGAGGGPSECVPTMVPANHGGGPGGSFGGRGGTGGAATDPGVPASSPVPLAHVRGGCSGQEGDPLSGTTVSEGGLGGGAVYMIAGNTITINGAINASGAGSTKGNGAGGGGGAGGLIGLDAPTIVVPGILMANGRGGSSGNSTGVSQSGSDPSVLMPVKPAKGGVAAGMGDGGDGSASTMLFGLAGGDVGSAFSAGGGGGGAGYIFFIPTAQLDVTGPVSPPAS